MGISINGGVPQIYSWFIREQSHLEMDDLGVPLFQEMPILLFHLATEQQKEKHQ